jgi:hypothetical protein
MQQHGNDEPTPPEIDSSEMAESITYEEATIVDEHFGMDWPVLIIRAAAMITFGATLITSFDISLNLGADWLTVMRAAILPFVGGALLLAAGELLNRVGR